MDAVHYMYGMRGSDVKSAMCTAVPISRHYDLTSEKAKRQHNSVRATLGQRGD